MKRDQNAAWKVIFLCLTAVLFSFRSMAQPPEIAEYQQGDLTTCRFIYKAGILQKKARENRRKVAVEVPPWVVKTAQGKAFFVVNGTTTNAFTTKRSFVGKKKFNFKKEVSDPLPAVRPAKLEPGFNSASNTEHWKRNYHGIYSVAALTRQNEQILLGFTHSENKNEVGKGDCHEAEKLQNTIQWNMPIDCNNPQTYSGGTPYKDGWLAYNGFLNAVWTNNPTNPEFKNELGPVAWPVTGYITPGGIKATSGLRHPSSIIKGDYTYIFYVDAGPFGSNVPLEAGRDGGIRVLRVHKEKALDPFAYRVYAGDGNGDNAWKPSLPPGFSREKMLDFVTVKGPPSHAVISSQETASQQIRFSVAKLKKTKYYIGVEQYIDRKDKNKFKVAIRLSEDLLNWSERLKVIYESPDWESSQMNYPVFMSKNGNSNTELDLDNFYVVGTNHAPGMNLNMIRFSLTPKDTTNAVSNNALSQRTGSLPEEMNFTVSPTLVNDGTWIRLNGVARAEITLLDMAGRVLRKKSVTQDAPAKIYFPVPALLPGIYLINIRSGDKQFITKIYKS